jgi:site-specific DNA recombinase
MDRADNGGGVGVYLRVSSEEQMQQGTIETQRVLERYVAAQGITPYDWYEDEAWSGYSVAFANRPAGRRLMDDIRTRRVSTVIVRKLDRFGRNAREILNAVHELEACGAQLISIKESVDTRTSTGRFFLTVLAGVAELERDMIVERSEEGMARRLIDTAYMGGPAPIGYRVQGRKRDARLVIDDTPDKASGYSEADVYRLAWHLCVEQGWSCEDIADRLTELGVPTRARRAGMTVYTTHDGHKCEVSHAWAPNVVYRMLTSTAYKGERTYRTKTGELVMQHVPALITAEQWDRAQAALADRARVGGGSAIERARDRGYLLRGMMHCGLCGSVYCTRWTRRYHKDGNPGELWRYYACARHHYHWAYVRRARGRAVNTGSEASEPQRCIAPSVPAIWIEGQVWTQVERFIRNPGEALTLLAARMSTTAETAETMRAELKAAQAELDAFQAQRDAILDLYRRQRISQHDLDRQLVKIKTEEATAQAKRDDALAAIAAATSEQDRLAGARTTLTELHAEMDSGPLTPERKRGLVERIIREIVVETHDAGISKRGRPKHRAEVVVYYAFHAPRADTADLSTSAAEGAAVPAQSLSIQPVAWRWERRFRCARYLG